MAKKKDTLHLILSRRDRALLRALATLTDMTQAELVAFWAAEAALRLGVHIPSVVEGGAIDGGQQK